MGVGASTCASCSQVCTGTIGSLIAKPINNIRKANNRTGTPQIIFWDKICRILPGIKLSDWYMAGMEKVCTRLLAGISPLCNVCCTDSMVDDGTVSPAEAKLKFIAVATRSMTEV